MQVSEWKQLYAEVLDREPPASLSLRVSILAAEAHADDAGVGGSRRVVIGLVAAAATVVLVILALAAQSRSSAPAPAKPDIPTLGPATNGWLAVDGYVGGDQIYLVRAGERARRLEVAGSAGASVACPAWSPDGTRLLFGRVTGSSQTGSSAAELVIVTVGSDGAIGARKVIALDGFKVLPGFDAHPCGTWSPDGRWIAFAGTGAVWVVDTQTEAIRRLPDLRPSDLEWRPGTDELAIAGDMGPDRSAPTLSTPVTIYSTTTSKLSNLGSVKAAHITWSPDGTTLAYTGGETDFHGLQLWLVDGDGSNERLLVGWTGGATHGIGPVWSPTGDRIAYQRLLPGRAEAHEVVLVNVADGTQRAIAPPVTNRSEKWYWLPDAVWWSPDGETLVYSAWSEAPFDYEVPARTDSRPGPTGLIAVPADRPNDATVLIGGIGGGEGAYSHQWGPIQMWGRQPE
jgi:Tol biopolymer transport system component